MTQGPRSLSYMCTTGSQRRVQGWDTSLSLSPTAYDWCIEKYVKKGWKKQHMCDVMKRFCTGVINHHWRFYSQQLDSCHLLFVNQSREWQRTANEVGHQKDEGDIHFDSCVTVETWEEVTHRMVDSPHHHAEQRVAGTEELHFLRDKVFFLGLRLARNGCGNAARRSHLSANEQLLSCVWKSWQNVLPWSHQLTTHYHRCYSFSLRTKKCPSSFLHATVTQARSTTQPDLEK